MNILFIFLLLTFDLLCYRKSRIYKAIAKRAYQVQHRWYKIQMVRVNIIESYINILKERQLDPREYRILKQKVYQCPSMRIHALFEFIIRPGFVITRLFNQFNHSNQKNHS